MMASRREININIVYIYLLNCFPWVTFLNRFKGFKLQERSDKCLMSLIRTVMGILNGLNVFSIPFNLPGLSPSRNWAPWCIILEKISAMKRSVSNTFYGVTCAIHILSTGSPLSNFKKCILELKVLLLRSGSVMYNPFVGKIWKFKADLNRAK